MSKKLFVGTMRSSIYCTGFVLVGLFAFQGCSGFDHLTAIDKQTGIGPSAADCGSCHVEQYREWQGSAHNLAYTDPLYREATDDYDDESCLACHIPESIRSQELNVRGYALHEGITCTSCHLEAGTMYGPHESSALVNPHPVKADTQFYRSSTLCGVCHQETFATWQKSVAAQKGKSPVPQCQECHMAVVTRTSTLGTNMFSKLLVSFEKEHQVHSHTIGLDTMADFPDAVQIDSTSTLKNPFRVRIRNLLPHNLPGGEYTDSSLVLVVLPEEQKNIVASKAFEMIVSDSDDPIPPGNSKQLSLVQDSLGNPVTAGTNYSLQLVLKQPGRSSSSLQSAKVVTATASRVGSGND